MAMGPGCSPICVEGPLSELRAEGEAARGWLGRSWGLVRPWGSGGVYPNFPDPDLEAWPRAYHGANLERLRDLKQRYDPDGFFRFRQSIPSSAPRWLPH
jgi:hypothetical protein